MKKLAYEVIVVLNPKSEKGESIIEEASQQIEALNVKVAKKDHRGVKDLIYKIKGQKQGDFWSLQLEAERPIDLKGLNIYLNREPEIIRYLVLKK